MSECNKRQYYSGKTTFMGKETPFEIEGFILKLFVDHNIAIQLFYTKIADGSYKMNDIPKPLGVNKLFGITNSGQFYLSIYFNDGHYSANNILGHSTTIISVFFHHLIVTDLYCKNAANGCYIGMYSKCFYKFLSMVPSYKMKDIDSKEFLLNLDFPTEKMAVMINYKGINVEIKPFVKWTNSISSFDYSPAISFKFSTFIGEQIAIDFIDNWNKLLSYLFMRTNIYADYIHCSIGVNSSYLYISMPEQKNDNVEDLGFAHSDSIEWRNIYKYIPKLFEMICNDDIYILNIKDSIKERLAVGVYSAGLDAAGFEYEFSKLYPDGVIHKEKTVEAQKAVLATLSELKYKSSRYQKKIYNKLIDAVNSDALESKIYMAFNDNKECLDRLKKKYAPNLKYNVMSNECAHFRNKIDHGAKYTGIDDKLVASFIMLRGLIYAMQLRRCGLNKGEINNIIFRLFNIKY